MYGGVRQYGGQDSRVHRIRVDRGEASVSTMENHINTKTRSRLGDKVKRQMTEVKMSMIRKRSEFSTRTITTRVVGVDGLVRGTE